MDAYKDSPCVYLTHGLHSAFNFCSPICQGSDVAMVLQQKPHVLKRDALPNAMTTHCCQPPTGHCNGYTPVLPNTANRPERCSSGTPPVKHNHVTRKTALSGQDRTAGKAKPLVSYIQQQQTQTAAQQQSWRGAEAHELSFWTGCTIWHTSKI